MAERPEPMNFPAVAAVTDASYKGTTDALVVQLDEALRECVKRAFEVSGKAVLKLKLTVAAKANRVAIAAELEADLPEAEALPTACYVDRSGRLVAEDPNQQVLPFEVHQTEGGSK